MTRKKTTIDAVTTVELDAADVSGSVSIADENVNALGPKLDLPLIGEEFTEIQEAALFARILEVSDQFGQELDETYPSDHHSFSYLYPGTLMRWNYGSPYRRGHCDALLRVGVMTRYDDEGRMYTSDMVLDFLVGDVYFEMTQERVGLLSEPE